MKNKKGTSDDLVEYHENGAISYEFRTDSEDYSSERTRNEAGKVLTFKNSKGFSYEYTRDEYGNPLTFKDSTGYSYEFTRDELGKVLTFKNVWDSNF